MLTQNEITSLSLSPTKKDFVQIWNELLEVAGKLSERWDPTSTNESDPGIVILKALAGIADKLNYNIDKNTLEAFMPTAAQEDSMRKLCDMLGYNIKYYQAAQVDVSIKYHNADPSAEEAAALQNGLLLPKFSVITNTDQDINYFTINEVPLYLTSTTPSIEVTCMEGQLVKCESLNDNHVITANQITENNRFYLPETQIAENGIFIYNVFNSSALTGSDELEDGTKWEKVDNLNVQQHGSYVYKFGYDSYESRPYIEFPEDYGELFGDGIFIYYARTSGAAGNISARTLTKLEFPSTGAWGDVASESISVENLFAATTGANVESIKQAYKNFKKTVGTFETLVTCRDYMNKIYSMTNYLNKPLVSNVLVTDIRNDLNRAITICSADRAGIFYKETPLIKRSEKERDTEPEYIASEINKPKIASEAFEKEIRHSSTNWYIGTDDDRMFLFVDDYGNDLVSESDSGRFMISTKKEYYDGDGKPFYPTVEQLCTTVTEYTESGERSTYWRIIQNGHSFITKLPINWINRATKVTHVEETSKINHFDLVLYPFKSYSQIKSNVKDVRSAYESSFKLNSGGATYKEITGQLKDADIMAIAHNMVEPEPGDLISINNYLKLDATISTTSKITLEEGAIIIDKIKIALANAFNMRELDFGDEIPFESLVEVIENADARIRVVSLNEPGLYTTFSVLDSYEDSVPVIKEYAVESAEHLTFEQAKNADRFDIDKIVYDDDGNPVSLSTFNTEEARKLYNNLAVRNVLAGRVPLFDYNSTFNTSFAEGAYQTTNILTECPVELVMPDKSAPFTICNVQNKTYSGKLIDLPAGSSEVQRLVDAELLDAPASVGEKTTYTDPDTKEIFCCELSADGLPEYYKLMFMETYVPENFTSNVITNVDNSDITNIETECKIYATDGNISDVELADGEFVKFRAPNFTTIKTYPAYVNYHLELNKETLSNAKNAEAESLFNVLNSDKDVWTLNNRVNNWQRVLNHFKRADASEGRTGDNCYVKTVQQTQEISAFAQAASTGEDSCSSPSNATKKHVDDGTGHCLYCGNAMMSPIQKGPVVVSIDDRDSTDKKDLTDLLNKSGCLKFSDRHMENAVYNANTKMFEIPLILAWNVADDEATPSLEKPDLDLRVSLSSPFITDQSVLNDLNTAVQTRLEEMIGQVKEDGSTPMLPTECDWTITFEYECVPFEPASLLEWKSFVTSSYKELTGQNAEPFIENGTIFWRVYGEGYASGKYILQSSEKLLDFDRNYFGLLPEARLSGIYLISNPGADAQAALIANDEEYRLRSNEYLYIEYTPSSTTEDGTTKEADAVTEIHGPGTIIKPSGFTAGLQDSSVLYNSGTSYHKTVTFETSAGTSKQVSMHKFNANEQVEIRDFARVELKKDSFKATPAIYYYKNFDCDILEKGSGVRKYTLKDGEYIFYTDSNKAELAYFTTGTEVILEGNLVLGKFEAIGLATIFDTGLNEIPWKYLGFSTSDDKIVFQEYQYITLGPADCINKLKLLGDQKGYLNADWLYCDDVEYTLAGSEEQTKLPAINTYDDRVELNKGCGWEVSSTLELDVSYNAAQTLRNTDKVQTSITLYGTGSVGSGSTNGLTITPEDADHPLSFKTNLNCQTSSNKLNIADIYNNPKKYKGFEFKFFTTDAPVIVETLPGTVSPYDKTITDLTKWDGEPVGKSSSNNIWTEVALTKISVLDTDSEAEKLCDKALRLPVSVLPKTYGVFSIYLDSPADSAADTWIEVLPGTSRNDITLFNRESNEIVWRRASADIKNGAEKLVLRRGLNCIRVNKTTRIFIKSDVGAAGSLFFDELKLVNSTPIEYSVTNDTNIPVSTYGLNVKQLGYLNPKDATTLDDILRQDDDLAAAKTLAVDETLRETFKDGCVTDTKEALAKLSETSVSTIKEKRNELNEIVPKLTDIKIFTETAKKELESMYKLVSRAKTSEEDREFDEEATEALIGLFSNYEALATEISREKALLKALNTNKGISAVENNFSDLINAFEVIEDTQEKLLEELTQLKTKAYAELAALSKETVIKDFDNTISKGSSAFSDTFVESLANQSKVLIDSTYEEELIPLVTEITKVVNSEERTNLFTILGLLKDDSVAADRVKLLTYIKKVLDAADSSELDSLLDTILSAANGADMVTLHTAVLRLEEYLKGSNFAALLAELETAFNNNENDYLKELITELKTIVAGTSTLPTTISTPISNIKAAITPSSGDSLLTKEPTAAQVKTIAGYASTLYAAVNSDYKSKLTTLIGNAETQLNKLSPSDTDTYSNAIKALQNSKDTQVEAILQKIIAVSNIRNNDLLRFDEKKTSNFKTDLANDIKAGKVTSHVYFEEKLPHSEEAIYQAWREVITKDTTKVIKSTVASLDSMVKALSNTAAEANSLKVTGLSIIAKSASNLQSFADKVYEIALRNEQTNLHINYLSSLSFPSSTDLTDIISMLTSKQESDNKRNKLIRAKIAKLNGASTASAKQAAVKELKEALTTNIDALSPIASAMVSMLCPNILLIEERLPLAFDSDDKKADPLYQSWATIFLNYRDSFRERLSSGDVDDFQAGLHLALSHVAKTFEAIKDFVDALKTNSDFVAWLAKPENKSIVATMIDKLTDKSKLALVEAKASSDTSEIVLLLLDLELKTADIESALEGYEVPESITKLLDTLKATLATLEATTTVAPKSKDAYNLLVVERQLLADLRALDQTDAFYYTAPSDLSLAIEFNESNSARNTLMNPATNYDVNNINNNFVISKLDIDYLDKGIQIARSSRLN